ncbi:hypothetical protein KIL84_017186 [Mauremys mutica]|uniref:Uncharacterized protein n=1 Tax=Mauremys mutica TaxID=74926 RepID=A0A9D3X4D5_9SAUR|nr:hypothetical protein KIL84_017186 [Mauremys mutica]
MKGTRAGERELRGAPRVGEEQPRRSRRHFTLPVPISAPPPAAQSGVGGGEGRPWREGRGRRDSAASVPCLVGNSRAEPERPAPLLLPPQQNGGAWSPWEPVSDSASPPRRRRRRHRLICIDQPPPPPSRIPDRPLFPPRPAPHQSSISTEWINQWSGGGGGGGCCC